jgi:hypothetical protein
MTKLRKKRVQYINNWRIEAKQLSSIFPAEQALIEKVNATQGNIFNPVRFSYSENDRYHYYLNFLIESLELLPLKVDLAFDTCWKGFESLMFEKNRNWKKAHEALSSFAVDYENKECALYRGGDTAIAQLMSLMPVQTCEYFSQKLLKSYPNEETKKITDRLGWKNNNAKFLSLLPEIAQKYNAPNVSLSDYRKSAMLLRKIFKGERIKVGSFEDNFSLSERFSLLILGVLYTFRNDRFHGNMHPPFKSSVATLQTYSHAHFCFLATHHIFVQSLEETRWASSNSNETIAMLLKNIDNFEKLYGRHLVK